MRAWYPNRQQVSKKQLENPALATVSNNFNKIGPSKLNVNAAIRSKINTEDNSLQRLNNEA